MVDYLINDGFGNPLCVTNGFEGVDIEYKANVARRCIETDARRSCLSSSATTLSVER